MRHNSEWLDMPMEDLFRLARVPTVAQLLERDDFAKRWAAREPISLLELLYPLLQGYDSVAMRADVELGGTDQTFNLLMGRAIQTAYGQPPQVVLTMPLLPGTDGVQKMSKSLGNHVGVTEPPGEMYGKTLSIPDAALPAWYELLLGGRAARRRSAARRQARAGAGARGALPRRGGGGRPPRRSSTASSCAHGCPTRSRRPWCPATGAVHLPELLADAVRRLALGGAAQDRPGRRELDGEVVAPDRLDLPAAALDGRVLQVGKRHFRRLRVGVTVHSGLLRLETEGEGQIVDLTEGVLAVVRQSGDRTAS